MAGPSLSPHNTPFSCGSENRRNHSSDFSKKGLDVHLLLLPPTGSGRTPFSQLL